MTVQKVKLIAGILYPDDIFLNWVLDEVSLKWGTRERLSPPFPFDKTDYYRDISPVLYRRFVSFQGLFDPGEIASFKLEACEIESRSGSKRRVNIDPGYIDGARLVLASTKDHSHRIYIGKGIYAEVTMRFRFGKWVPFDYTFPDFASGIYDPFLEEVRKDWLKQRRQGGCQIDREI